MGSLLDKWFTFILLVWFTGLPSLCMKTLPPVTNDLCCILESQLHATVMNARHRKWVRRMLSMNGYSMGNEMFRKTRTKRFDSFDAQGIVRQHGSEEWGEYLIREAHLSQRFVVDDNGYYHCCASMPFPENMQIE
ncbi:uncharacterized protein LOC122067097 isoform X1 [Macadamia integrifolia]|uniref:uncharacterized protein LOC122067097 isoform X1 n=1 Tax=Macadamia integrifolia TaxID=60698 RepID=UPI001C4F4FFE|nr:uncharacterized protein LOC122067097 isoform X1 [Macadamia integrifolia]